MSGFDESKAVKYQTREVVVDTDELIKTRETYAETGDLGALRKMLNTVKTVKRHSHKEVTETDPVAEVEQASEAAETLVVPNGQHAKAS